MLQISIVLLLLSIALSGTAVVFYGAAIVDTARTRAPTVNDSPLTALIRKCAFKRQKDLILSELSSAELFISRMLMSGVYAVHEIIGVAADMTVALKPYFQRCYNRYFSIGTEAIDTMKEELPDDSFSILCDTLKYAASFDKREMGRQISEHLEHLKKLREYKRQRVISHKEGKFVFTLVLPIVAFLIVQVYPWVVQAINQLSDIW